MEDRIEEQQLGLFADRTSCRRSLEIQFRLTLSSAAYVLVQALRRTAVPGTELAQAQVGTIRLRPFKVAARVVVSTRRAMFHLAGSGDQGHGMSIAAGRRIRRALSKRRWFMYCGPEGG